MRAEYSRLEAADLTGIDRHRLQDWQQRGYITPSIQTATGTGTKNLFSVSDLYLIRVFRYLVDVLAFSRETAAKYVAALREQIDEVMRHPLAILGREMGSGRIHVWDTALPALIPGGVCCDLIIILDQGLFGEKTP